MSKLSNIVIAGGGSGAILARALSRSLDASKYNVVLINNRPSRIHLVAGLRMAVTTEGNFQDKGFLPYDRLFYKNQGTFKLGTVTRIDKEVEKSGGHVVLEDGERIPFHVLVLATGSKWTGPIDFPVKAEDIGPFIEKSRREIAAAKRITIVGAGAIGLELSGEIKDVYPDKEVTIVHGDSLVLNKSYPEHFRTHLQSIFNDRGISFVLGDRLEDMTIRQGNVTTRNGTTLNTDLVISARGATPNTSMIISSLGNAVASPAGFIKVKPTLQLLQHSDIFAMGDILDIPEQKQIAKASAHASTLAANIPKYLADPATNAMKPYGGMMSREMIAITNGKGGGAVYMDFWGGWVFGDWLARLEKSKGLLIWMFKWQQGY